MVERQWYWQPSQVFRTTETNLDARVGTVQTWYLYRSKLKVLINQDSVLGKSAAS